MRTHNTTEDSVRIMLVDDQDAVRIGWKELLERSPRFTVVAATESGEDAAKLASRLAPDICLVDLRLAGLSGPALVEALLNAAPKTRVVILTSFGERADIIACLSAGASGYLSKDTGPDEMREALNLVMAGKQVCDFGETFRPLLSTLSAQMDAQAASAALTPREVDVLRGVAKGMSNAEIGEQLGIAERTVKNILSNAMRKLRAPNRTAAAMLALDEDLI